MLRTDALTLHQTFVVDTRLIQRVRAWIHEALAAFGELTAAEATHIADSASAILHFIQSAVRALDVDIVIAGAAVEVHLGTDPAQGGSHLVLYRRPEAA